jgi:SagB-type dehydrogenase family enzyme
MMPASIREIGNFIQWTHRPVSSWITDGTTRTTRLASSAGGIHPIEIIVITPDFRRAFHVDAAKSRLELLELRDRASLKEFGTDVQCIVPAARSHFIVLAADFQRTEGHYTDHQSLVLRDAGVLLQTLHLCATAYRLAFCPLGILGHSVGQAIFGSPRAISCVGVASVGRPE